MDLGLGVGKAAASINHQVVSLLEIVLRMVESGLRGDSVCLEHLPPLGSFEAYWEELDVAGQPLLAGSLPNDPSEQVDTFVLYEVGQLSVVQSSEIV